MVLHPELREDEIDEQMILDVGFWKDCSCANYSDLSRGHLEWCFCFGNPPKNALIIQVYSRNYLFFVPRTFVIILSSNTMSMVHVALVAHQRTQSHLRRLIWTYVGNDRFQENLAGFVQVILRSLSHIPVGWGWLGFL